MTDWQPIATAPKDGTWILAVMHGRDPETGLPWVPASVRWLKCSEYVFGWDEGDDVIWTEEEWPFTHWMPLPTPPRDTIADSDGDDGA